MTHRILFVCLGNICRSPLGEGIMRHLVRDAGLEDRIEVDSAGTGAYHAGEAPDPRSREVAGKHGISLDGQRARKVAPEDFHDFDLVLAMDQKNLEDLRASCPPAERKRLRLMRSFDPEGGADVPDPYFGGASGFEDVFAMVHRCCESLLESLVRDP
ncbi:MAG: low molecular weight protein-tyrosine-phosphatase [Planctomycetota bacterium]